MSRAYKQRHTVGHIFAVFFITLKIFLVLDMCANTFRNQNTLIHSDQYSLYNTKINAMPVRNSATKQSQA